MVIGSLSGSQLTCPITPIQKQIVKYLQLVVARATANAMPVHNMPLAYSSTVRLLAKSI
jgi:hypothetical protein